MNRRDDYLDPEFHERDPNYHKPIHCMEENSDRNQMGHYINVCTGKGQGNQNPLDDYLEPGESLVNKEYDNSYEVKIVNHIQP